MPATVPLLAQYRPISFQSQQDLPFAKAHLRQRMVLLSEAFNKTRGMVAHEISPQWMKRTHVCATCMSEKGDLWGGGVRARDNARRLNTLWPTLPYKSHRRHAAQVLAQGYQALMDADIHLDKGHLQEAFLNLTKAQDRLNHFNIVMIEKENHGHGH
jgi:hypothetical protein